MTTLNLTKTLPPDQTSFSLIATQFGYTAEWAQQPIGQAIEIWQNTTNSRSTATKVGTVYDTYFDSGPLTVGQNYYIWTRRLSNLGTPGNWDYGETAGQVVVPTGVPPANLNRAAGTSYSQGSGNGIGSTVPSSWDTWTDTGTYMTFTAPSGTAMVKGWIAISVSVSSVTGSGSGEGDVLLRAKLRNTTDSVDVPGKDEVVMLAGLILIAGAGNVIKFADGHTFNVRYDSGFGANGLIAGKSYRVDLQLMKTRTSTAISSVSININGSTADSGTSDSVSY